MPQPDVRDVHIDAILTNFSLKYSNLDYIVDQIFPSIPVQKQSDKYFTYTKSFWFRDLAALRAPGTESEGSGWGLSTDSYFADNYAFHVDIPDELRENADNPLSPDQEAVEYVTDRLAMKRERAFSSSFFTTGVWTATGSDAAPSVLWSTYGTSDPIVDIETASNAMRITTGRRPNTLIMGAAVWSALKNHPDMIDRIKYTQKGMVTQDLFASLIDIPKILIGQSIIDTSAEGAASSFSDIWGKSVLLLYVDPNAGPRSVTAGATFVWSRFGGGALQYMRRLRLDRSMVDRVEGLSYWDQKVIAPDLGYFFNGAVA
jgi:hypothetical protein